MDTTLLSLCIPTNGVSEWVFPVLDSIYGQAVDLKTFEVIVTDNGSDLCFRDEMYSYSLKYSNLYYKKTESLGFANQIDCFRMASGRLIKFINHRMTLMPGAIAYLISIAELYQDSKPVIYFSNRELVLDEYRKEMTNFDDFMRALGYWSTWSAGVAMWKDDLDRIDFNEPYSVLFPHTLFLFSKKNAKKYIIDDHKLLSEIQAYSNRKGKYNVFYAFCVEYIGILRKMLKNREITYVTYGVIKKELSYYVSLLFYDYVIMKKESSFDLKNYKESIQKNYSLSAIMCNIPYVLLKIRFLKRIKRFMLGNQPMKGIGIYEKN